MARLLALAFRFSLLESSRYSPIPTQSSDVTTWLLHGLHYIRPRFAKKDPLSGLLAYHFSLALSQIHAPDKKSSDIVLLSPSLSFLENSELRYRPSPLLFIIPGGNSDVQINWVTVTHHISLLSYPNTHDLEKHSAPWFTYPQTTKWNPMLVTLQQIPALSN